MDETEKKRSFETVEEWEAAVAHQGKRIREAGPRFWQDRSLANAVYVTDPFVQLGITVFGRQPEGVSEDKLGKIKERYDRGAQVIIQAFIPDEKERQAYALPKEVSTEEWEAMVRAERRAIGEEARVLQSNPSIEEAKPAVFRLTAHLARFGQHIFVRVPSGRESQAGRQVEWYLNSTPVLVGNLRMMAEAETAATELDSGQARMTNVEASSSESVSTEEIDESIFGPEKFFEGIDVKKLEEFKTAPTRTSRTYVEEIKYWLKSFDLHAGDPFYIGLAARYLHRLVEEVLPNLDKSDDGVVERYEQLSQAYRLVKAEQRNVSANKFEQVASENMELMQQFMLTCREVLLKKFPMEEKSETEGDIREGIRERWFQVLALKGSLQTIYPDEEMAEKAEKAQALVKEVNALVKTMADENVQQFVESLGLRQEYQLHDEEMEEHLKGLNDDAERLGEEQADKIMARVVRESFFLWLNDLVDALKQKMEILYHKEIQPDDGFIPDIGKLQNPAKYLWEQIGQRRRDFLVAYYTQGEYPTIDEASRYSRALLDLIIELRDEELDSGIYQTHVRPIYQELDQARAARGDGEINEVFGYFRSAEEKIVESRKYIPDMFGALI